MAGNLTIFLALLGFFFLYDLSLFFHNFHMGDFRVASLNVNGARECIKRAQINNTMNQKKLDVLFLQETHSDKTNADEWAKEFKGLSFFSHKSSISGGVAILFANSFTPSTIETEEVVNGRLLKIRAHVENHIFIFICVYAPTLPAERMVFLHTLCETLDKCNSEEHLFLGGDFNCVESDMDRNHVEPHLLSRKRLIQLIKTNDLCDVWRSLNGNVKQYTWAHARDNRLSLARLDRFYVFKHYLSTFKNCFISPVGFSDHSIVICTVTLHSVKPRSAYWHFNTNLLSDAHFRETFTFFWENFKKEKTDFQSLEKWWEFGKVQIKQLCQQYTHNVTKDIINSIKALEDEILKFQEVAESSGNQMHIESLFLKKSVLSDIQKVKAQGALVRSRFRDIDQMDVPSKFFFSLEKKNGQKRFIHSLFSETGFLESDPIEIRKRANNFYEKLYSCEHREDRVVEQCFYEGLPKVSEETNAELKRAISLGELHEALQSMENGKAPGIDGIPVEFYKAFWPEIGEDLLAVLSGSLVGGLLPLSCRRAVLTLLPKKGDVRDIKNWRPVSLLCYDYKLLSKVLATRLGKVLEEVIHSGQSYCVPGRSIFDNIHLMRDVFDVSKIVGVDMGLISLDQEKAFDRVEHDYLWKTLQAFGFSSDFIGYIKILYNDIESLLKVNGGLCAPFRVCRGVRQGCSLSGILYTLAIEPLLNKLRRVLEGVSLQACNSTLCLSAYADDVVIILNKQNDVDLLVKTLRDFGTISSAKINWGKSEAVLIGKWERGVPTLPNGLSWKKDGLRYLGVFLGDETIVQKNWEGIIEKMKGRLLKWKWIVKSLSYRGRTLIINNLVASSLWHRLACIDPPAGLLAKIQSLLVDFFWEKMHWIPHNVLYVPKEEGGQGLVHLQSRTAAFRLQFVQRFLTGPEDLSWRPVASTILKTAEGLCLDKSLFLLNPSKLNTSRMPEFYKNLFKVWDVFNVKRIESTSSLFWLLKEPLIYGSRLDILGACGTMSANFIKSKITTLGCLINVVGSGFEKVEDLAVLLGVRSMRIVAQVLHKLQSAFTTEEAKMLQGYCKGEFIPDKRDTFPNLLLSPKLGECTGVFLESEKLDMELHESNGKKLYKACVKAFNKKGLHERVDTPWRTVFQMNDGVRPEWRALYKPPLAKRDGDLQWRILHGIIAVNAFISVLNPDVGKECPFCFQRETVFHTFLYCSRLKPLFDGLQNLFNVFDESFSVQTFILGFKYVQKRRNECQLLNFILGKAKMAIYISRRDKIEKQIDYNVERVFTAMIKSRLVIDFRFYKAMDSLNVFEGIWCHRGALCSVIDNELHFALFL